MIEYKMNVAAETPGQFSLDLRDHSLLSPSAALLKRSLSICIVATAVAFAAGLHAQSPANTLQGRWDLTIDAPGRELPSWIEVSQAQGRDKLVMVGVTDHATPLKKFEIEGTAIEFVSPKGEEGFPSDMSFAGKLVGRKLEGTVTDSAGDSWHWAGVPGPSLDRKSAPHWERSVQLFDGKDLDGWRLLDPARTGTWKVENGFLVSTGHGTELVTNLKFEDFKLHIEFKCSPSSNSGVFLRGRYEVQIETDSAAEPNSHHTGGVYGFLDPAPEQPRRADVWQSFDITLVGRKITVVQNGTTIIDNQEIPGITGGALDSREALPGPIYLQGSEENTVMFRNIVITPAKERAVTR
jgi:Domain of Unknown Function (DUF1080)